MFFNVRRGWGWSLRYATLLYLHGGPSGLESPRGVVDEPRLLRGGEGPLRHALREGHPPQQRHQLTTENREQGTVIGEEGQ